MYKFIKVQSDDKARLLTLTDSPCHRTIEKEDKFYMLCKY